MALSIEQAQVMVAQMISDIELAHMLSGRMLERLENARNGAAALSEGGYELAVVQAVLGRSGELLRGQRAQRMRFDELLKVLGDVA